MARVLLTGMSGTGKSTVLTELGRRGRRTVHADDDAWAVEVTTADGATVEQLWRADRMAALLAGTDDVVVAGCASNQGRFYPEFDAVILLSAPLDVMLARIAARTDNPFGRTEQDRARILADKAEVEPQLRRTSTAEVATDRPLDEVVEAVEALIRRAESGSA